MKILHLSTSLSFGGAEQIILDLCQMSEHDFHIAALQSGDGQLHALANAHGLPVTSLEMRHKLDWGVWKRLQQLMQRESFDLIHTHLVHANFIGRIAAAALNTPVVSTIHIVERRFRPAHKWMEYLTAPKAHTIIAVSAAVYEYATHTLRLPAEKIQVINNGIDTARFCPRAQQRDTDVVFVGRLVDQKGLDRLLPALKQAATQRSLSIAIVGRGSNEEALKKQAQQLDLAVDWVGFSPTPEAWMARSKLCVVPSRFEGFGLVAAEALACGCRVLHSGVDSLAAVCGEYGITLSNDNTQWPTQLLEALKLDNDFAAGRNWVIEHYDRQRMIDAYRRLYQQCVA